jgi:hypothetical protein
MNEDKRKIERLQEIILSYRAEAERCQKAKAFFAGTVMLGAEIGKKKRALKRGLVCSDRDLNPGHRLERPE